jgi:hypothetical protein
MSQAFHAEGIQGCGWMGLEAGLVAGIDCGLSTLPSSAHVVGKDLSASWERKWENV